MKHPLTIVMLIFIVAADQISKFYVLTGAVEIIRLNDFLNITQVWNEGISFGLFSGTNSNLIFLCLTSIIAILIAYLLLQTRIKYIAITYAFILGGALGNIIDRIRYGAVFDFIDIHIADMHWPAFNIADSFVCIGGAMLVWNMVFSKNN